MIATEQVDVATLVAEVTVPSDRAFQANPVSFELTDYARDLGARVVDEYCDAQGNCHAFGEIWVSGTAGHRLDALTSYWDTYHLPRGQVFATAVRAAGDGQVGVAPCFVQPAALGMATRKLGGQDVLTMDDGVVYYPQKRVRESYLLRALAQCQIMADAQPDGNVDEYFLPRFQRDSDSWRGQVGCVPVRCYQYQGRYFVYANRQWYHSEPIAVSRQANGNIQCRKILFSAPHGDSRGANTLYSFLNQQFLTDLSNHRQTRLRQLRWGTQATLALSCER